MEAALSTTYHSTAMIDRLTRYSTYCWVFAVPVSMFLLNVFSLATIVLWMASSYKNNFFKAIQHKVSITAIAIVILSLLGLLYSHAEFKEIYHVIRKTSRFLLIPVCMTILEPKDWKTLAIALLLAVYVNFVVSFLKVIEFIPSYYFYPSYFEGPLRDRIYTGGFFALTMFFCLQLALDEKHLNLKILYYTSSAAIAAFVLFLCTSLISHLLVLALVGLFVIQIFNVSFKSTMLIISSIIGFAIMLIILNPHLAERYQGKLNDIKLTFRISEDTITEDIVRDFRFFWYQQGAKLMVKKPILGYGTAGIYDAYSTVELDSEYTKKSGIPITNNPHNQFLAFGLQFGLVGVSLLLYLFYAIYTSINELPENCRYILKATLITYFISCCFNSWLYDISSGYLFMVLIGTLIPLPMERARNYLQQQPNIN